MARKEDEFRPTIVSVLTVILFIISIGYFAYSGAGIVDYLLSNAFGVQINETVFDFIIGIITMVASIIIFIGCIYAWKMKDPVSSLMVYGSVGFILKNVIEIINIVVGLVNLSVVQRHDIALASAEIGANIFHLGFWVFVAIFFSVASFRQKLVN